jgi:hypothetical protein
MCGPAVPCGLWQSEQATLPSSIGWRDGRRSSARCVAGEAHLALRHAVAHVVMLGVDLVARAAGDLAASVRAAIPMDAFAALMAGQADRAALFHRRGRVLGEVDVRLRRVLQPFLCIRDVLVALAVTAGAGTHALVGQGAVLGAPDLQHLWRVALVVAGRALGVVVQYQVLGLGRMRRPDHAQRADAHAQCH